MEYAPLHCHSAFSFSAGVPSVRQLVAGAGELGMKALALTDTDRVSGLIRFYLECRSRDIKPILGVELTDPRCPQRYVVLLARNATGYGDLFETHDESKSRALARSISKIRDRSGFGAILTAATLPVYESEPSRSSQNNSSAVSETPNAGRLVRNSSSVRGPINGKVGNG